MRKNYSPIWEGPFDLDFMQESGDIREDMSSAKNGPAVVHEFSDGVLAISYAFLELGGN